MSSLVPLFRTKDAAHVDVRTQEYIDAAVLMEAAGRAVWEKIWQFFPNICHCLEAMASPSVVFLAGSGNNGGDAMTAARWALLCSNTRAQVITTRHSLHELSAKQMKILEAMGVARLIWEEDKQECLNLLQKSDLIVDGIAGVGITGPLRQSAASLVDAVNNTGKCVVAIDMPSGARDDYQPDDPLIHAQLTIVTGLYKQCLYIPAIRAAAQTIAQVDVGFLPHIVQQTFADAAYQYYLHIDSCSDMKHPATLSCCRASVMDDSVHRQCSCQDTSVCFSPAAHSGMKSLDVHKGQRGKITVIGGSDGTGGAAVLTSIAALYNGSGMVRLLAGKQACAAALVREPALMVDVLEASAEERIFSDIVQWTDVIAAGPGWMTSNMPALKTVFQLAAKQKKKLIFDAQALRLLAHTGDIAGWIAAAGAGIPQYTEWLSNSVVLTPHMGEMAALTGADVSKVMANPYAVLENWLKDISITTILKGSLTFVANQHAGITVFDGRLPELATAGSGDVLAGVLAAALVFTSSYNASCNAVRKHLCTGRLLAQQQGLFTASELAQACAKNSC